MDALSVFKFDNNQKGIEVLKNAHITIVTNETIHDSYTKRSYEEERSIKEYFSTVVLT